MIIFISLLSFLLDGLVSKFISINSLFLPLLTITSFPIIYIYFKDKEAFFKYIFLIGFIYDIAYTNAIFYNTFIFLILGFIIYLFNYFLSNHFFLMLLIEISIIICYRFINYLISIIFIKQISFINLLILIKNSFLLNIIWFIIIYFISKLISKKYNIKPYR